MISKTLPRFLRPLMMMGRTLSLRQFGSFQDFSPEEDEFNMGREDMKDQRRKRFHEMFHRMKMDRGDIVQIGEKAPDFTGTAYFKGEFVEKNLEQYKGKYLVLFFYPMDFTFVCPTEIVEFSTFTPEFEKIGTF